MIKGTTPTHTFTLPFNTETISKLRIIYSQNDNVILVKQMNDCVMNDKQVSVTLTQEDTFLFEHVYPVEIQIRVLTLGGNALASVPEKVGVSKCLDSEVLI